MKKITTILMACAAMTATAQDFDLSGNRRVAEGMTRVTASDVYSPETGYGYDFLQLADPAAGGPSYFSIDVPDGNYTVTLRLGSPRRAAATTVRAESRRLLVNNLPTRKGEIREVTFTVNKRTPRINDRDSVSIKPRERRKLNWDNKLTLEINGDNPAVQSISVRPANDSVTTVFLCGNSTVVDQDEEPWASWGQMIPSFFDETISVANIAESGESASSFSREKRWQLVMERVRPGDYVFIEFGHNDEKLRGAGNGAWFDFMSRMKKFVDEARAKGANPVLVTPTQRRKFNTEGALENTHGEFPDAVRFICEHENVPLIELNAMTTELYESLGVEGSKSAFVHYPAMTFPGQTNALEDNTHFNPYGAYQIARCVATGIANNPALAPLAAHFTDAFVPIDLSNPDDPAAFHWDNSPFMDIQKPDGN